MSWDLDASLKKALVRDGWVFGDKYFRIGNPFSWVDGNLQLSSYDFRGVVDIAQWFSGYYEEYPTLESLRYDSYETDYKTVETQFEEIYFSFFPFEKKNSKNSTHIKCHALARIQDFCMFKKYAPDLICKNHDSFNKVKHLDFGAGMGGSATYSLLLLGADYTAIEAHPWSYDIQRMFFRQLVQGHGQYMDLLGAESMEVPIEKLKKLICENFAIKQIPSWFFQYIPSESYDLLTATTVLNELNIAAIIYMLAESSRVIKEGGYFYIRDSAKLKPGRHHIDYDNVLTQHLGFELVQWLDVKNRVDMFAIPRLYKKIKSIRLDFESLFETLVGRNAVTSHGSDYAQNLKDVN